MSAWFLDSERSTCFGRYYYTAVYPGAFFVEAIHFLVDPYY